jgi:hypothetical protein
MIAAFSIWGRGNGLSIGGEVMDSVLQAFLDDLEVAGNFQ